MKLLIANRGEIAVRIARSAREAGIATVTVHAPDDARSLHVAQGDESVALKASGVAAYLDMQALIEAAKRTGATHIHPGYGFLSESAAFAEEVIGAGLQFVGPAPETLALFGDKVAARRLADGVGVPLLTGTREPVDIDGARAFFAALPQGRAMILKALAGGGGRGTRVVTSTEDLPAAFERATSEALKAFGRGELYAEEFLPRARHVEVQIAGDGTGAVVALGDRECSLQRQFQKIIEIAPAPGLPVDLRAALTEAALALASRAEYRNLGTFEFLLEVDDSGPSGTFAFIEANARLQVEHTVTEEVTGLDLVALQLGIAQGKSLAELGLSGDAPAPRGTAIQLRVNMERMGADGLARPSSGTLKQFDPPTGPGIRVDTFGYAGLSPSPHYDSLLAKVIVHTPAGDFEAARKRAARALSEFRIAGLETNLGFLQRLLCHEAFSVETLHTRFLDEHIATLATETPLAPPRYFVEEAAGAAATIRAGAQLQSDDPLAVLSFGQARGAGERESRVAPDLGEGLIALEAPMQGTVLSLAIETGATVPDTGEAAVMEAMKMEHVIAAPPGALVREVLVSPGEAVGEGARLAVLEWSEGAESKAAVEEEVDLDAIRPDLAEVLERHALGQDERRPEAVEKRRKTGQRTARENLAHLVDADSFVEYGPLVIAAQQARRPLEELIVKTPADGLIAGVGEVNGATFGSDAAQCVVMTYDYTVMAGTQGMRNHVKTDRMLHLARDWRLPVVVFTEGGGGRPGDTDAVKVGGLDVTTFHEFGKLSGKVPLVGINSGYCFAGNAALLGCCDVIIATANSSIGMGGPAMIEGGGLGIYHPAEVGPMSVQVPNGVVDIPVADEEEAVEAAKKYLGYFQGDLESYECADQRLLRWLVPENRKRAYDIRKVIDALCDTGSVLELRREFGHGMITALVRIEGKPVGLVANNPAHLGGAIDAPAADKAARFMQLCDAFGLPLVFLADTPGIMVGPEVEKTALVRHVSRLFVTGSNVSVPMFTVVLRKSYGLGAQTMAGGSYRAPFFVLSWPTGEFGGMGIEGAVKLGFRRELEAIADPDERKSVFEDRVAKVYAHGRAANAANYFEFDDTIDPATTRHWISAGLKATRPALQRRDRPERMIDTW